MRIVTYRPTFPIDHLPGKVANGSVALQREPHRNSRETFKRKFYTGSIEKKNIWKRNEMKKKCRPKIAINRKNAERKYLSRKQTRSTWLRFSGTEQKSGRKISVKSVSRFFAFGRLDSRYFTKRKRETTRGRELVSKRTKIVESVHGSLNSVVPSATFFC